MKRKMLCLLLVVSLVITGFLFPSISADDNNAPNTPIIRGEFNRGDKVGYVNYEYLFKIEAEDLDTNEELEYRINWDGTGLTDWQEFNNEKNQDGKTVASKTIYHTWTSTFSGKIKVQVRDDDGAICTNNGTQKMTVYEGYFVVDFDYELYNDPDFLKLHCWSTSESSAGINYYDYCWDPGVEMNSYPGEEEVHFDDVYDESGIYTVTMEVWDKNNAYDQVEKDIRVGTGISQPPILGDEPLLPDDGQENYWAPFTLEIALRDLNGDTVDVKFFDGSNDLLIDTITVETGDVYWHYAETKWQGRLPKTKYYWYVTLEDDDFQVISPTWEFTTESKAPIASFTWRDVDNDGSSTEIEFDASASHDPDGSIVEYQWFYNYKFRDSRTNPDYATSNSIFRHDFGDGRSRFVHLKVIDSNGDSSSYDSDLNHHEVYARTPESPRLSNPSVNPTVARPKSIFNITAEYTGGSQPKLGSSILQLLDSEGDLGNVYQITPTMTGPINGVYTLNWIYEPNGKLTEGTLHFGLYIEPENDEFGEYAYIVTDPVEIKPLSKPVLTIRENILMFLQNIFPNLQKIICLLS